VKYIKFTPCIYLQFNRGADQRRVRREQAQLDYVVHGNLWSGCGDVTIPAAHSFSYHAGALIVLIQHSFSRGNRQRSSVVEFDTEKGLKRANAAGILHW
jgi:hypothetical protein